MTTREERKLIKDIIKTLKECRDMAWKDEDITTSPNDSSYYEGLGQGYNNALELIRKLKT